MEKELAKATIIGKGLPQKKRKRLGDHYYFRDIMAISIHRLLKLLLRSCNIP